MAMTLQVLPGTYYVGLKRPSMFFIRASRSRIDEELGKLGFRNIKWHDRGPDAPPVNPRSYPAYRDSWDEWVSAEVDSARIVQLPSAAADAIGWIVGMGPSASPYTTPATSPASTPTTPNTHPSIPSPMPSTPVATETIVPTPFDSPDAKELLRVAGPSALLGEVAVMVFMGLYARNRAAAKAEKAVERAASRR